MNFDAVGDNVRGLLTATRSYVVPRFQRDFSWDENNYKELLNDLLSQITCDDNNGDVIEFKTSQYYLGNMIFLGTKDKTSVEIIDGQQRLTTGTILLAAIRDSLYAASKRKDDLAFSYAETTQNEYLVKKIDGSPQRKLQTTSSYPYFTQTIQGGADSETSMEPSNDEEEALKKSFEFFKKQLSQNKLFSKLNIDKPHVKSKKDELFINTLKAIRDQFLNSEIVEIFVADNNQAHRIFENINSKGKPLSQVDLIKNDIFSKLEINDVGVDYPTQQWKEINLVLSDLDTTFDEFFLHFWKSEYPSDSANGSNLYKKYLIRFKSDDENHISLKKFVKKLQESAKTYANIINPLRDDFKKQETKIVYQSLDAINKFRGVQSRVALLSLFNSGIEVKQKKLNNFLFFLANFHMAAFGTDLKVRSNLTTNKYKSFCQKVNNAKTPEDIQKSMLALEKSLLDLINEDDFKKSFVKLVFQKDKARNSMSSYPASYAIKVIADKMDGRQYNDDDYSIEHILDEAGNRKSLSNIGNISVLERKYNDELCNIKPKNFHNNIDYKIDTYNESSYKMIKSVSKGFNEESIPKRAQKLADYFWNEFLKIE
ncbi:DUF262 domain-containing protein [Lactiplantibacillus plantarum]|uniref:DUF262 domain-containing protein n=1 Tax=Lactiplantibacillus plantarum TaxID=1590 RepID=UPI001AAF84C9|nr:DUF262 domain-containing protein [Lactiplantibacillus plantarum]MBO2714617.1 DUF262 domain-containing protein [Lactiplantibacillus plantarum]